MLLKFNVFGKLMSVRKVANEWQLFNESETGMRTRVYDVVVPQDLLEEELATYLDDIYHEYASEKHPYVVQVK